jgi:nucleoside-diphosphate-sugar epimerase
LLNNNWEVHCLLRRTPIQEAEHKFVISYIPYDLSSFDAVFHIAGVLGRRGLAREDYRRVHVDLTELLLQSIGSSSHTRFVYMSTAYVESPEKDYEITKLEGEALVKTYSRNWTIVRPGFVYGPGDKHLLPLFKVMKWCWWCFPLAGGGENIVAPTYVDDVVGALVYASVGNGEKIVPVAGRWMPMRRFLINVATCLGRKLTIIPVPAWRWLKSDFFARERAFQSYRLGTDTITGLAETVRWYREHHWL